MSLNIQGDSAQYNSYVSIDSIREKVGQTVKTRVDSYDMLQRLLEGVLSRFEPDVEVLPTAAEIDEEYWDGRVTVVSKLHTDIIHAVIREVCMRGQLVTDPNVVARRGDYELEFPLLEGDCDEGTVHFFLLSRRREGTDDAPLSTLPLFGEGDPLSLIQPSAHFSIEKSKGELGRRLREAAQTYLESIGKGTASAAQALNQADWYDIFRSLGPVAAGAGFAASGVGGILGLIFQGVATVSGAASAATAANDFLSSEQADALLEALTQVVTSYTAASAPSVPLHAEAREAAASAEPFQNDDDQEPNITDWYLVEPVDASE